MKVAVSAAGPSIDSQIDPRFGRCQCFLIVDNESMDFEAVENPAVMAPGGAGIQAAELVVKMGAEAVITGNCGPNAYEVLSAADIDVFVGASGSVREAIEGHRRGELLPEPGPSTGPYSGIELKTGAPMSRGMGRGRGGGMSRGRGGGMGGGRGGGMGGGRGGGMGGGRGGGMGGRGGGMGGGRGGGMGGGRGGGMGGGRGGGMGRGRGWGS